MHAIGVQVDEVEMNSIMRDEERLKINEMLFRLLFWLDSVLRVRFLISVEIERNFSNAFDRSRADLLLAGKIFKWRQ